MSTTPNPATITFEQLMALSLKTEERLDKIIESMKETDRKWQEMREQQKESERKHEEAERKWQQTREDMKEANQRHGKLSDRIGDLIQAMVYGGIKRLFRELGYDFDVINQKYNFGKKELDIYGEVDLLLENGEFALLVEVKTNLSVKDVKEHKERLQDFRLVSDAKNDKRKFIAAVGGGVVPENVKKFALKQGMFVVQQSGENVEILVPEGKPKVW